MNSDPDVASDPRRWPPMNVQTERNHILPACSVGEKSNSLLEESISSSLLKLGELPFLNSA